VLGNFLLSSYFTAQIADLYESYAPLYFYLEAVRGALNLYVLFAGYSDVAIGFGLMLGYRVMENFNNPFLRTNIAEFWRAWHISLTSWSRDYVYMPVVGFTRSPYLGTLASLIVIGIWHELSLRYIMWGIYHGVGIIFVNKLQQVLRNRRRRKKIKTRPKDDTIVVQAVKIFLTANYVFFGYIIISQDSIAEALNVYRTILLAWVP
jgi:alginate O-acetyltransferase complex protein AlgI